MYRPISGEELLERYAAGERNFAGFTVKVPDIRFCGNLTGIDLSNSILTLYMKGIILVNANLCNARLTDACLDLADLTNADLRGCDLRGAKFGSANLTGADLRDARFDETNFSGANLTDANFSGTTLDALFGYGANLTHTNFRGVNIRDERLRETIWNDAILLDTIMPDGSIRSNTL
jgi:uncharacterized protein YjbI with pentapeptide repeats